MALSHHRVFGHSMIMQRIWTLAGVVALALTIGVMVKRPAKTAMEMPDDIHDAVASPVSPTMLGGARVAQPDAGYGYFARPSARRAEAEAALTSSKRRRSITVTRP